MKRTVGLIGLAILGAWLVMPGPALAWQEEPVPDEPDVVGEENAADDKAGEEDAEPESKLPATRRPGRGAKEDVRKLITQVVRLREAMQKKIDLSSEQEEVIGELFEEHLRKLKELQRAKRSSHGDKPDQSELRAMRDELIAARASGDREALRALYRKMRTTMRERLTARAGGTAGFIEKVKTELDDEQQETFHQLLARVRLDRFTPPADRPLRRLVRSLLAPELELSPEQREKIRVLTRAAVRSGDHKAGNTEKLNKAVEELRSKAFAELTDEQRAMVEQLIEEEKSFTFADRRVRRPHRRPQERGEEARTQQTGEQAADTSGEGEDEGDEEKKP